MAGKLAGSNDLERLADLCGRTYKEQAVWFLNAFWDQFQGEAEKLWKHVLLCADLDSQRHADGTALDELNAHRFLEQIGETLTVVALRERLRKTGAIGQSERPKAVPLTHYILWRYEVDWHVLVNSAGDNSAELNKAQALLDGVTAAFRESEKQAAYARLQEAPFKAAQEEVDAALADVNAQESARDNRTAELQRKSTEGGIVQQNKAKAELAQHLAEDPLPLRKAKITLEAALKRAEKARAPFEAATKVAEAARQEAEAARQVAEAARREAESARRQAEAQRQAAEESLDAAGQKVEEAEAYLAEVKAKPGSCHGAIWWMEKELEEQKKYLPSSKGGVAKRG